MHGHKSVRYRPRLLWLDRIQVRAGRDCRVACGRGRPDRRGLCLRSSSRRRKDLWLIRIIRRANPIPACCCKRRADACDSISNRRGWSATRPMMSKPPSAPASPALCRSRPAMVTPSANAPRRWRARTFEVRFGQSIADAMTLPLSDVSKMARDRHVSGGPARRHRACSMW